MSCETLSVASESNLQLRFTTDSYRGTELADDLNLFRTPSCIRSITHV